MLTHMVSASRRSSYEGFAVHLHLTKGRVPKFLTIGRATGKSGFSYCEGHDKSKRVTTKPRSAGLSRMNMQLSVLNLLSGSVNGGNSLGLERYSTSSK